MRIQELENMDTVLECGVHIQSKLYRSNFGTYSQLHKQLNRPRFFVSAETYKDQMMVISASFVRGVPPTISNSVRNLF
jgi:hypothetical protein